MEKRIFNKFTKEIFLEYGFIKEKNNYILNLEDVTIVVKFCSWRGVKSFNYYFYINELYDESVPFEKKFDSVIEIKMEHTPELRGYHAHEILYEEYDEKNVYKVKEKVLDQIRKEYKDRKTIGVEDVSDVIE